MFTILDLKTALTKAEELGATDDTDVLLCLTNEIGTWNVERIETVTFVQGGCLYMNMRDVPKTTSEITVGTEK